MENYAVYVRINHLTTTYRDKNYIWFYRVKENNWTVNFGLNNNTKMKTQTGDDDFVAMLLAYYPNEFSGESDTEYSDSDDDPDSDDD